MALRKSPQISDARLLTMLKGEKRDAEAATQYLMEAYLGFYRQASRQYPSLSGEELQDAYTDAVLALTRKMICGDYQPAMGKLSTLFHRIFFNKCADQLRRNTNQKGKWWRELEEVTPNLPLVERDFLGSLFTREDFRGLERRMDQLRPPCKDLILDMEYWGYDPEEAARRNGYKNGHSASQAKFRCLEALRKLFGAE